MAHPSAADMMADPGVTLSPDTDMRTAIRNLLKHRITGAPVVDATGHLLGILSEKDCLRAVDEDNHTPLSARTVADYMSAPKATITPDSNLYDIVGLLLKMPFRRLPVLDGEGHFIGQVVRAAAMRGVLGVRDNPHLYGAPDITLPSTSLEEGMGVDSAIRMARGQETRWRAGTI